MNLSLPHPQPGFLPSNNTGQNLLNTISEKGIAMLSSSEHDHAVPVTIFNLFSATNPYTVVQHAGYYYLESAVAQERSWELFMASEKVGLNSAKSLNEFLISSGSDFVEFFIAR